MRYETVAELRTRRVESARSLSTTYHASTRLQQRGIPPLIIQWLEDYGREVHDGHGGVILCFDKDAKRRLQRVVGREPVRRLNDWLDIYAVYSLDGRLITTGHRYQRIKR